MKSYVTSEKGKKCDLENKNLVFLLQSLEILSEETLLLDIKLKSRYHLFYIFYF